MEGYCATGQSPQWAVVPMEEEVPLNCGILVKDLKPILHCALHHYIENAL